MELTSLRNAIVGLPGVTGLSVEQRKRLTIGVELVSNPGMTTILFGSCTRLSAFSSEALLASFQNLVICGCMGSLRVLTSLLLVCSHHLHGRANLR